MPGDLHSRLMESTGVRPYLDIPTLASWKGDVVRAKQRLQQFRAEDQRKAIAKQFDFQSDAQRTAFAEQFQHGSKVNPAAQASRSQLKQLGFVAAVAAQQPQARQQQVPQKPGGRVAGDLTDPYVIDAVIERYQAGKLQAGNPDNQISKAILGAVIVDIYTATGQFMRIISRNPGLRTDKDCALFPFYRALHWAAADAFGQVFGINGEEIDVYLREQLIIMSEHGFDLDKRMGAAMVADPTTGKATPRLVYLNDEEALALQLHVRAGKLMITNAQGGLSRFDCSGDEYKDQTKDGDVYAKTANPCYQGDEKNGGKGVAGFVMGLNRNIYATKHWLFRGAPKSAFYHSSYLEGRDVLCAGCITVVDGALTYINNASGHYKPPPQQLAYALQALQALGIDITNVVVDCRLTGKQLLSEKAPNFLARKDINDGMAVVTAISDVAKRIRDAMTDYESRFKGFKGIFTSQNKKSADALKVLKGIRDDKTLVKEVRFLVGPYAKRRWPNDPIVLIDSPVGTLPNQRFFIDGESDLRERLVTAIEPLLRPQTRN